jgi:hypothetical protein
MKIEEIRLGLRVRHSLQPLTGTVRRIRGVTDRCATCGKPMGDFAAHDISCIPADWVFVQWDTRKDLLIAVSPSALVPEIDLRLS